VAIRPGYLTEPKLAEQLGKSVRALQDWRTRGTAPPYTKAGVTVLYRDDAVEAWLRAREHPPVRRGVRS
jgi:hypothetical protein